MPPDSRWSKIRSSFRFKLFLVFTLLTALLSVLFCTLYISSEIHEKHAHIHEQMHLLTRQLADSISLPLYAENRDALQQHAEQSARSPEMHSVVITTRDGRVLAEVRAPDYSAATEMLSDTVEVRSSLLASSPEAALSGGSDSESTLLGFVRMERGTEDLSRKIHKLVIVSWSMAIGSWLTVSLLCHLILRRVTRSFNTLVQGINAMQDGDFSTRIEITSNDEPGRAAHAINELACTLQQRGTENIRLQEERLDLERRMLHTQKLESLGVMAGGIAHDFNNLLQSILGNMELAERKLALDPTSQRLIDNAMNSAKRAAHLTGLMLAYAGKGVITKKKLNLNSIISENAEMLRAVTSAAVSMELCLAAELPNIMADEAHIQQVVMNLMSNAAESIEGPSGLIRFTTGIQNCDQACLAASLLEEKPKPGHYVFLEVCDNGCGMDEQTLKRLFDPFFTTKFTGRGLGMSAVIGIIRTHCGALFVESEAGKGTTITALFPVPETALPATDQEPATPLQPVTIAETPLCGMALVVDDEKPVLKICSKMVKLCGFTVITACDGIDAVTKFREHADLISVVLMDLTMPNMDGITAMAEIYSIRPDSRIILSSGFNKDELGERLTNQAPSGFIRKPYSMNVLETELRRVLQAD